MKTSKIEVEKVLDFEFSVYYENEYYCMSFESIKQATNYAKRAFNGDPDLRGVYFIYFETRGIKMLVTKVGKIYHND